MHPEEIKAALRIKGVTLTALAGELKLSRSMVTQVIYGYARSRRVQERIAKIIGKPINAIWLTQKPRLRRQKDKLGLTADDIVAGAVA
ncbi:helix-turn-helix domain-containing protein [Ramlibacter sp. H39-3-26]|uniref:helix-turn-helix domain-containing protein n=1 Tax=Curvibacter soli TaxID=3031331 RepID=UPI0023D9E594|nr:helix-turn-helix domain-containing protein [Ramlibacter sp. H39-3-26]MDF1483714.1 helix-turn-helix domain-containing protein [Ramlibacter sp. H39-3-26]